jgi:ribose transport system permease protein
VPGAYTLLGIAAIVLGGVSLAGGRGGVAGPIVAVVILALVRTDLTLLGAQSNLSTVIQGTILIGVVMFGSLLTMRQARS